MTRTARAESSTMTATAFTTPDMGPYQLAVGFFAFFKAREGTDCPLSR